MGDQSAISRCAVLDRRRKVAGRWRAASDRSRYSHGYPAVRPAPLLSGRRIAARGVRPALCTPQLRPRARCRLAGSEEPPPSRPGAAAIADDPYVLVRIAVPSALPIPIRAAEPGSDPQLQQTRPFRVERAARKVTATRRPTTAVLVDAGGQFGDPRRRGDLTDARRQPPARSRVTGSQRHAPPPPRSFARPRCHRPTPAAVGEDSARRMRPWFPVLPSSSVGGGPPRPTTRSCLLDSCLTRHRLRCSRRASRGIARRRPPSAQAVCRCSARRLTREGPRSSLALRRTGAVDGPAGDIPPRLLTAGDCSSRAALLEGGAARCVSRWTAEPRSTLGGGLDAVPAKRRRVSKSPAERFGGVHVRSSRRSPLS
jgi:hypothetical protein